LKQAAQSDALLIATHETKAFLIILRVTGIAVCYAYTEYNRTNASLKNTKAPAVVTAPALLAAFEKDTAAAAKQYNDKIISVSGTIKKIEANGNPVVLILGDAAQLSSVQCSMYSTDAERYKTLKNGMATTLKGLITGFRSDLLFGTDVILPRCVVESNP
jgi:hypothetical protein